MKRITGSNWATAKNAVLWWRGGDQYYQYDNDDDDDDDDDDCDDGNGHLQKSSPKDVRKGVLVERRNDPIVVTPGRARVGFHMHEKCSNTFSYTCTIR